MNNKKMILFFVFLLSLFFLPKNIKADYNAIVSNDDYKCELSIYNAASGRCIYKDQTLTSYTPVVVWLDKGDAVYVYEDDKFDSPDLEKCNDYYVKVRYNFPSQPDTYYYGYFCHAALTSTDSIENNDYIEEFKAAGFPESYWDKLLILKVNHPNWTFVAANTGLDFYEAVRNESVGARSVIRTSTAKSSNYAYAKTGTGAFDYINDRFIAYDDINGSNPWIQANTDTIAYYMDPRNFLIDMYIFQFETLTYNNTMTDEKVKESIEAIFQNDYLINFVDIYKV